MLLRVKVERAFSLWLNQLLNCKSIFFISTCTLSLFSKLVTCTLKTITDNMNVLVIVTICLIQVVYGFPDGAPVDACVKPKPNQPYHGQAEPQPINTLPYSVVASASQYAPGQEITGKSTIPIPKLIQARISEIHSLLHILPDSASSNNLKRNSECVTLIIFLSKGSRCMAYRVFVK